MRDEGVRRRKEGQKEMGNNRKEKKEYKRKIMNGRVLTFEVFTAVTMKNAVFWDIKPQFVLHRRHITSLLQSPAS
jgi:hypothetical protein